MQKWLIDQYGSATEITDSRFTILDDLGVLTAADPVNGGEPAYAFKADADMPVLSGADIRALGFALLSLGTED
jgi:hypothetical protein